jgi:putative membrane protein
MIDRNPGIEERARLERDRTGRPSGARRRSILGGLVGIGLAVWLLSRYGFVQVLEVLARLGWLGMLALILFHLSQMLCSALGWQVISAADGIRTRTRTYLQLRWVREAVNNLLPAAQNGGESVAARLLHRRGVPLATAIGGTIGDLVLEMATQVLFTVLGIVLLARVVGHTGLIETLTNGLLFAVLTATTVFAAAWLGLAAVIEEAVIRLGRSLGWPATRQVSGLQEALIGCYRWPGRVAAGAWWHLLSWLLGGIEVWLVLHFFGRDVSIGAALIIESLGQAAKALAFGIPGAIGVQEGGYVVACRLLGISPEIAIALSLVKRLREVALGLPGLLFWHRIEGASDDRAVA